MRALAQAGWRHSRTRGSHAVLEHPTRPGNISVPLHDEIGRGLLRRIVRDAGLGVDDFVALLQCANAMNDYHEIVDLQQFAGAVRVLAMAVPVVAVLVGLIAGAVRKRMGAGLVKGVAVGLFGPIVYGLWLMYSYLVRYDPQTGTVGLHRVSVLLLNVAVFAVVGVLLGLTYSRVFRAASVTDAPPDPTTHAE